MDRDTFFKRLTKVQKGFAALSPELELTVHDNELGIEGYVVVWNTIADSASPLGRCGKGGTRITPSVSLDEVRMLARTMALKNAAAGLPLGGAKSGLRADPNSMNFEQEYRRFVNMCKPILSENGGIFGGFGYDIGAIEDIAIWTCDELGSTRSFTGKPVHLGGTDYDEEGHAGLGVAIAAKTVLDFDGVPIDGIRFAVQGGGAMGAAVIRYFSEFGASLQSISGPICGATYHFGNSMPKELLESLSHRDHPTTIRLLAEGSYPTSGISEILYEDVDVLFPCAVQNVITVENADRIQAKYVIEGANAPCTPEARSMLFKRGIKVIPDFIANPGGIIAAYTEMTTNVTPDENAVTRRVVEEAKELVKKKVATSVSRILRVAKELQVEPATVGEYLAYCAILGEPANLP